MDGAGLALHAVDQHAPEIADFNRQLALPKEIGAGVGRLEPGQIENANIDRRDGHARLFARREPGEMNGQRHGLARPRQLRRVELDVERMRTAIDGEPGDAKRAAGHAFRPNVERAMGQRDGVGAGAPVAPTANGTTLSPETRSTSMKRSILSPTSATVALPAKAEAMRNFASSPAA